MVDTVRTEAQLLAELDQANSNLNLGKSTIDRQVLRDLVVSIPTLGGGGGVTILDLDTAPVTSVNNVVDTTLWSVTLPTRTWVDPDTIRVSLYGSFFNNSGSPVDFTVRTRFGSAQLARFDNQNPLAAGTSTYFWQLNFLAQKVADNANISTQFFLSIPAGAGG